MWHISTNRLSGRSDHFQVDPRNPDVEPPRRLKDGHPPLSLKDCAAGRVVSAMNSTHLALFSGLLLTPWDRCSPPRGRCLLLSLLWDERGSCELATGRWAVVDKWDNTPFIKIIAVRLVRGVAITACPSDPPLRRGWSSGFAGKLRRLWPPSIQECRDGFFIRSSSMWLVTDPSHRSLVVGNQITTTKADRCQPGLATRGQGFHSSSCPHQ